MDISLVNVPASARVDLEKWAEIVIEKWQFNLSSRDLVNTGNLINSFLSTVSIESNNNSALISFVFLYYLRMIDMGVGRGISLENVSSLAESRRVLGINSTNRRQKKPVYSKTLYAEIMRLGELLALQYATQGASIIVKEFVQNPRY